MIFRKRTEAKVGMSEGLDPAIEECFDELDTARREIRFLELDAAVKESYIASLKARIFDLESRLRCSQAELADKDSRLARLRSQRP
jgi:septal ring factor EnvC (AmiA/AmiB activator)